MFVWYVCGNTHWNVIKSTLFVQSLSNLASIFVCVRVVPTETSSNQQHHLGNSHPIRQAYLCVCVAHNETLSNPHRLGNPHQIWQISLFWLQLSRDYVWPASVALENVNFYQWIQMKSQYAKEIATYILHKIKVDNIVIWDGTDDFKWRGWMGWESKQTIAMYRKRRLEERS